MNGHRARARREYAEDSYRHLRASQAQEYAAADYGRHSLTIPHTTTHTVTTTDFVPRFSQVCCRVSRIRSSLVMVECRQGVPPPAYPNDGDALRRLEQSVRQLNQRTQEMYDTLRTQARA